MVDSNFENAMKWEVEKFYAANKAKNKASTDERKAQKELDILMAQSNEGMFHEFDHTFDFEGRSVTIDVKYQQSVKDTINLEKLYKNVDQETFFRIVTASKAAVEKNAGKNIANLCISSEVKEFKAQIKERK